MQAELNYQKIGNERYMQVVDLILPIQQGEFNVPVRLEDQPDLLDIDRFYWQTGGGFWGALHGEQVIGTIGLIAYAADAGAIRKMFVHRDFRGRERGVASRLLETLLEHCRATGIRDLFLGTVEKLQAAIRFYEKNGFTRVAKADLPPNFPRMEVDTIFYHLHLG